MISLGHPPNDAARVAHPPRPARRPAPADRPRLRCGRREGQGQGRRQNRDQEPEAAPRARQARRRGQDPARAQGQARRRPSRPAQPVRAEVAEVANRPDRQDRQARPDRRRRQASRQLRRQEGEGAGALPRPRQEAQGGRSPQPEEGREPLREALHAGPGRERRPLRLPRPGRLPAAVPERLLHEGRPRLGDRQAAEPERASMPANTAGDAHRPDRHQPRRRLQPGQPDHDQDPRARHAGGVRRTPASSPRTTSTPTTTRTSR